MTTVSEARADARADHLAILAAALRYAAAGWPVFPCTPGAKVPAIPSAHPEGDPRRGTCAGECGRTGHGFKDATTDPDVIRSWWARWPDANVAIATGAPGPDVLDVDTRPEGSGFGALGRVRAAGLAAGAGALVRTPSGGLHLYYRGSSQGCGRLPRHWLDFKASGGYVLAPPSQVDGRSYVLAEHRPGPAMIRWESIRSLLDPPRPARPSGHVSSGAGLTDAARSGILRVVADANNGGHWSGALFWAGCRYGEAGAPLADALAEVVSAASPWNEREAARAQLHVRNGWTRGQCGQAS